MAQIFWIYLAAINVLAFGAFAFDKAAAQSDRRRIAETTLLTLALIGGSLGALAAQQILRHKTRKQPFRALLIAIAMLHVVGTTLYLAQV